MVSFRCNNESLFISGHWVCVLGKAAPVFNLWLCVGGMTSHHHSQGGCDVKAQRDEDLLELSAADASNPDKAKSANSVSLILVYICLPVPAVQPCPHHCDRAWWRRNCIAKTPPPPPPPQPCSPPPPLAFTDPISTRASQRKPQSLSCHLGSPSAPYCTFLESDFHSIPPLIETPCTCASVHFELQYRILMGSPSRRSLVLLRCDGRSACKKKNKRVHVYSAIKLTCFIE